METIISNGLVIDPKGIGEGYFDVLLQDGVVKEVVAQGAPFLQLRDKATARTVDAAGKWVTPGLLDIHVHLREPGFEWKETIRSGAEAAVLGGFTTVCCMPNTKPRIDAAEIARFVVERGKAAGLARVFPIGAVSIGLLGKEMAPLSELAAAGCVAFSDDGEPVWDAGLMRRALEWCLMHGTPITCHEEDKALTAGGAMNESALSMRLGIPGMPKAGEDVLVARDIELARLTGGRVHLCHMSTARSVELLRRAKQDGIPVTGEVAPHHLTLTEDAIGLYDTNAKMSPPLREQEDVDALRKGLADGTIDCIASDHAPHEADSKQVEFTKASFGILGLQTTLPLILGLVAEGVLTRSRAIDAMTRAAARCFNLDTGAAPLGGLSVGCAADVTVIDPDAEWTLTPEVIASKSKNTPYMGNTMRGKACTVIVGGNIVVAQGRLV